MFRSIVRAFRGNNRVKTRKQPHVRLRLEALEERWCPAPVQNFWQPGVANGKWSGGGNWSLGHVPLVTERAVFDTSNANRNQPVEVDATTKCDSILYQAGYNKLMTIDANVTLETVHEVNFSTGTANIDFKATSSMLQVDGGNSWLNNFAFTDAHGTFWHDGGALTIGNFAVSNTNSDFFLSGIVTVNNTATANFLGGAIISIGPGDQMTLANTHIISLYSADNSNSIIENMGTFTYGGGGPGGITEIDMPFLNYGSAVFDSGNLTVKHQSNSTGGFSMKMETGTVTLKNGMNLYVDQGYYQVGGVFSVADATSASLQMAANTAEFDGGNVQLGTATTFGKLVVVGGDLIFMRAEFDAKIDGQNSLAQDQILCTKTIRLLGSSNLVVTAVGAVAQNRAWSILTDTGGNNIVGDFGTKSFPTGVTGPNPNPPAKIYWLTS